MRKCVFPISGSGGVGDTWEGHVEVNLSEKDYARLEASVKKGFDDMMDDPEINDIYERVFRKVVDITIENEEDMIDEYREDFGMRKNASPRKVIEEFLGEQCCTIHYPADVAQSR